MEKFYLMNSATKVLSFFHERTEIGDIYSNVDIFAPEQLPVRLRAVCSGDAVENWINRRSIPVNRHHMKAVLGALNLEKPFDLMRYSHALSLNDTFWIKKEDEDISFSSINLYDNKFDEALGWIAFTGLPSDISRNLSTPELTTFGMLPKYWQRIRRIGIDDIILCKGGTSGYSNAGYEPYNEVAAFITAKYLGIEAIPYHLEKRNGKIVSISELFTTKSCGLVTASEYLDFRAKIPGYRSLRMCLEAMAEDNIDLLPFYRMCLLDYIIENFDRHLNNWGFSVDNVTQQIIGISPIWDNGMSLDFGKPADMRTKFDFASFNVKYDFVKSCTFANEFKHSVNHLLTVIRSGRLFNEIYAAVESEYPSEDYTKNVVKFIEERCLEFQIF
ncbi:MAG: hypothetical protein LBR98_04360 [Syntrophomonadaceae bacterium]|jgi:hypothetical protein|nr:hypothetical protein [Syntrophomonadaceae bacterium]